MNIDDLKQKIQKHEAAIAIVGMGYVGLPLAMSFLQSGYSVTGLDIDAGKIEKLNNGISYIEDIDGNHLKKYVGNGQFMVSSDFSLANKADCISICVPTPLDTHREPDISYIVNAAENIVGFLRKGQLIVLESTTYPGTTEEVLMPILEKSGLKVGEDIFLAFSPERVDPGNQKFTVSNTPRVVGGVTLQCTELAKVLYSNITCMVCEATSPRTAEMEKLYENIFRAVNIALVNELALLCQRMNIDMWEVIELAKTKPYGFMPFYPGPGLGGHCIPIDPFYLTWKAREYDFNTKFIELAGEINTRMPYEVVILISEALSLNRKCLKGSKVLILGMAYKKDVSDVRSSPSIKLFEILKLKGAEVSYNDPFVEKIKISGVEYKSVVIKDIGQFDCIVIATDHTGYDYGFIAENSRTVVDTRNAMKDFKRENIVKL